MTDLIAYKLDSITAKASKRCRIGRILQIVGDQLTLHRYYPVLDGAIRVKWKAVLLGAVEQKETLEVTAQPSTEVIPVQLVIMKVHLPKGGVLGSWGISLLGSWTKQGTATTECLLRKRSRKRRARRSFGWKELRSTVLRLSRRMWSGWHEEELPRPGGWLVPPPARSLHPLLSLTSENRSNAEDEALEIARSNQERSQDLAQDVYAESEKYWKSAADLCDWVLATDPRRESGYRRQVLEGLGLGEVKVC